MEDRSFMWVVLVSGVIVLIAAAFVFISAALAPKPKPIVFNLRAAQASITSAPKPPLATPTVAQTPLALPDLYSGLNWTRSNTASASGINILYVDSKPHVLTGNMQTAKSASPNTDRTIQNIRDYYANFMSATHWSADKLASKGHLLSAPTGLNQKTYIFGYLKTYNNILQMVNLSYTRVSSSSATFAVFVSDPLSVSQLLP